MADQQDAVRAAESAHAENRAEDYAWFDTAQAAQHYPELTPLTGWNWWWAGAGEAAQLVGYRYVPQRGVDLIYIDVDKRAALTRSGEDNQIYLHELGELSEVLAHVPQAENG